MTVILSNKEFAVEITVVGYGKTKGEIMAIAEKTAKKKVSLERKELAMGGLTNLCKDNLIFQCTKKTLLLIFE